MPNSNDAVLMRLSRRTSTAIRSALLMDGLIPRTQRVRDAQDLGGLVPYGKAWRMGADEPQTLVTQKPILMGGTTVPAARTLCTWCLPKQACRSWPSAQDRPMGIPVDETKDLARVDLKKDTIEKPVDQFTMAVEKNPRAAAC